MSEQGFPRIIAFCCNWCSYAGADLAGVSRLQMPPDFQVIRVMCSARVAPEWVIKALAEGVDGVLVLGCHIGDCHYISGNHRAAKRFALLKEMLGCVGIHPDRLLVDWVSASEGARFQRLVTEFVERVKELGPMDKAGNTTIGGILCCSNLQSTTLNHSLTSLLNREPSTCSSG